MQKSILGSGRVRRASPSDAGLVSLPTRGAHARHRPRLWDEATSAWLFMRGFPLNEPAPEGLSERFLAGKHFSGTHGLEIDARMQVEIAAQACILVLELGIEWYQGWSEIIVYPSQFAPEREVVDDAGVVHLTNDAMAGEAWLGGPVVLSYEDVAASADESQRVAGYNVVIHEFAHKLDMRNGDPNGFPPLHEGMSAAAWKAAFAPASRLCARGEARSGCLRGAGGDRRAPTTLRGRSAGEFFASTSEASSELRAARAHVPVAYAQLGLCYDRTVGPVGDRPRIYFPSRARVAVGVAPSPRACAHERRRLHLFLSAAVRGRASRARVRCRVLHVSLTRVVNAAGLYCFAVRWASPPDMLLPGCFYSGPAALILQLRLLALLVLFQVGVGFIYRVLSPLLPPWHFPRLGDLRPSGTPGTRVEWSWPPGSGSAWSSTDWSPGCR